MTSSDHSGHEASRNPENATGQAFRQIQPSPPPGPALPQPIRWLVLGLAIPPILIASGAWIAPKISVGAGWEDLLTFLSAVVTVTTTLFVLAHGRFTPRLWLAIGLVAASALGIVAITGVQSVAAIVVVGSALMTLGHGIGHAVGSRIEHAGHLLPACVVAGCVDIASVLHPQGPTHAIVRSERAVELLLLSFPVLGTHAFAPSIGVGDVVFAALLLGTATRHRLSALRFALLIAAGLVVAGLLSALLARAVPALPTIGLCVVLGVRQARILDRKDRRTALGFMAASVVVTAGVVVSRFLE